MTDDDEKKVFFQKPNELPVIKGEKNEKIKLYDKSIDSTDVPISLTKSVESVTILGSLIDEMTHLAAKTKPKEVMGLLGGKEIRSNELSVTKILHVSSEDDFDAFEKILDEDNYCIGWWHSHPSYGLFLSNTDIHTHIYSFQLHNEQSIALVIEPSIIEANGRAAVKCYQVVGEQGKTPFHHVEVALFIQH
jgi:proteasome lid subunit RPN8/RPN11